MTTVAQLIWLLAALAAFGLMLVLASCMGVKLEEKPNAPTPGYGIVGASNSMVPAFRTFDLVYTFPVTERPFESLVEGEVVNVMKNGKVVAMHRLMMKCQAGDGSFMWVTKGDGNPTRDFAMLTKDNFGGVTVLVKKAVP